VVEERVRVGKRRRGFSEAEKLEALVVFHPRLILLQRRVRDPSAVPQLAEDPPARRVHRVGDRAPSGDLRRGMDSRRPRVARALLRHLRRLGDDQPCAGALPVVLYVQRSGRVAGADAIARHRRHHDAVGQFERPHPQGRENIECHVVPPEFSSLSFPPKRESSLS